MADCGWDDCDGRHRDRAGCDGGSVYLWGVASVNERQQRAIDYIYRVREERSRRNLVLLIATEYVLLVIAIALACALGVI